MLPNINSATARVLDAVGINLLSADKAGCCGALRHHLNHQEGGLADARRNIDAWWPYVMGVEPSLNGKPIEAIVMTASGCGAMVSDYGHLLRGDPQYADKAKTISKLCKDLSEILPAFAPQLEVLLGSDKKPGVVYHPPCTLQHGQQIRLNIERLLSSLGVQVALCADSHLCCGSAGTYSILQPALSAQLRQQKLTNLNTACAESGAKVIVSANVGCITHLLQESNPVVHWVEILDQLIQAKNPPRQ
jgi:glycolate oxidase iron-sulfur subunit